MGEGEISFGVEKGSRTGEAEAIQGRPDLWPCTKAWALLRVLRDVHTEHAGSPPSTNGDLLLTDDSTLLEPQQNRRQNKMEQKAKKGA